MFTVKLDRSDFKDPSRWTEIANALELPEGRTWAIVARIPGLLPVVTRIKIECHGKEPDEWMLGEAIDGKRQWIIHTRGTQFIAEIVDDEDDALNPPFEYRMSSGQWLCNFTWYDDAPPQDLMILCREAEEAIEIYDEILGID